MLLPLPTFLNFLDLFPPDRYDREFVCILAFASARAFTPLFDLLLFFGFRCVIVHGLSSTAHAVQQSGELSSQHIMGAVYHIIKYVSPFLRHYI